jgi:RND superfamily putative drug exporter
MRLMGRWNWWAPGPLGRFADRLGFSHAEDEGVDEADAGDGSGRPIGDPSAGLARP